MPSPTPEILRPEHLALARSVGSAAWSRDGSRIAYLRPEVNGRVGLRLLDLETGEDAATTIAGVIGDDGDVADRRDHGGGPQWSPDGRHIAVLAGDPAIPGRRALWVLDVETGESRCLTRHFDDDRSPRWSPDGTALAYVAYRDGMHQLMLSRLEGGNAIQLTHGRFECYEPRWSPDGRSLVYTTQWSDVDEFSHSIAVLDIDTSRPELLTDDPTVFDRAPQFSPDGTRIVFVSDRDGFDNVWLLDLASRELRALTATPTEKNDLQWLPDGSGLIITETRGVTTGISRLDLDGTVTPIIEGEVSIAPRVSADGTRLLYLTSSFESPMDLFVAAIDGSGARRLTRARDEVAGLPHVKPSSVRVESEPGVEVELLVYRPRPDAAPGPAVLYVHGGPNTALQDTWTPQIQLLAQRGYTVVAPNYRGSLGYGRAWRDASMSSAPDAGDVVDWLAARAYLASLPEVDETRIAVMGRSYGGHATMFLLGAHPTLFRAGVAICGVSDWAALWDRSKGTFLRRLLRWIFGSTSAHRALMDARSALPLAAHYEAPLLLEHGEVDGIDISQSRILADELQRHGKHVELRAYPGEGHVFAGATAIVHSNHALLDFLARHCQAERGAVKDPAPEEGDG